MSKKTEFKRTAVRLLIATHSNRRGQFPAVLNPHHEDDKTLAEIITRQWYHYSTYSSQALKMILAVLAIEGPDCREDKLNWFEFRQLQEAREFCSRIEMERCINWALENRAPRSLIQLANVAYTKLQRDIFDFVVHSIEADVLQGRRK